MLRRSYSTEKIIHIQNENFPLDFLRGEQPAVTEPKVHSKRKQTSDICEVVEIQTATRFCRKCIHKCQDTKYPFKVGTQFLIFI